MKKLFLFILIINSFLCYSQKWNLVWSDEFNASGYPDKIKWSYETGIVRNHELQYYTSERLENARIEDSVLVIEAKKEKYMGANYTSASIISRFKGDWLYGKVEVRAKIPNVIGTWPAIWMMPTDNKYGSWPKSGEIDIMENVGYKPDSIFFTAHFTGDKGTKHVQSGSSSYFEKPYDHFLTYSIIWTPVKIEWYVDGILYHTFFKKSEDTNIWPFNQRFYLILNLAFGGTWGGSGGIDDSKLPVKFYIDWVRVYQMK